MDRGFQAFDAVLSGEDLLDQADATGALGVAEVDLVSLVDAQGRVFYRHEALPPTHWEGRDAGGPAAAGTLFDYPYGISVVNAVDLWTAQEATTERIPLRTQDLTTRWVELRFTEKAVGSDGCPQLPDSGTTWIPCIPMPADCWITREPVRSALKQEHRPPRLFLYLRRT